MLLRFADTDAKLADAKYTALQNKCDLSAQLAECCCEQKEQAAQTRALILSETQRRLESDNADLRMQLLIKKGDH